ncbi:hypothetical protein M409DRAFT_19905 [Zasmidium cellare ATCC 36951]|uniref:Uncharacterized protein n=1 Tax=Zasmidium cellare ATCC 36951 TaxID=1080233 RepID=A0A6A6CUB9_ZASCE|nr:uncharacterized protein M409DRAFT_19905 [Zasmidium cellare ATCC 36951]KAF2170303.1 hypothetical protein M409DRAFT_19905 [Zasmidium cellare ATCC 36951]
MSKSQSTKRDGASLSSPGNYVVASSESVKQLETKQVAMTVGNPLGVLLVWLLTMLQIDCTFVESAVRFEATQTFQQALFDWQKHHQASATDDLERCPQTEDGHTLEAICRQYGHTKQAQASPLERWATLTNSNAEFPLHAKICMESVGVAIGSLESVEMRARAAKAITSGI